MYVPLEQTFKDAGIPCEAGDSGSLHAWLPGGIGLAHWVVVKPLRGEERPSVRIQAWSTPYYGVDLKRVKHLCKHLQPCFPEAEVGFYPEYGRFSLTAFMREDDVYPNLPDFISMCDLAFLLFCKVAEGKEYESNMLFLAHEPPWGSC